MFDVMENLLKWSTAEYFSFVYVCLLLSLSSMAALSVQIPIVFLFVVVVGLVPVVYMWRWIIRNRILRYLDLLMDNKVRFYDAESVLRVCRPHKESETEHKEAAKVLVTLNRSLLQGLQCRRRVWQARSCRTFFRKRQTVRACLTHSSGWRRN